MGNALKKNLCSFTDALGCLGETELNVGIPGVNDGDRGSAGSLHQRMTVLEHPLRRNKGASGGSSEKRLHAGPAVSVQLGHSLVLSIPLPKRSVPQGCLAHGQTPAVTNLGGNRLPTSDCRNGDTISSHSRWASLFGHTHWQLAPLSFRECGIPVRFEVTATELRLSPSGTWNAASSFFGSASGDPVRLGAGLSLCDQRPAGLSAFHLP